MRMVDYDVVVVGGGAGGCAAAWGAARLGRKTLLIERYGFLGGAATAANVLAYCGFFPRRDTPETMVAGAGAELLERLAGLGMEIGLRQAPSGNWIIPIDGEAVKLAFDEMLAEAGVTVWLHATLTGVERTGQMLARLTVTDPAGGTTVTAGAVVDASGDAALAAMVGLAALPADGKPLQTASACVRLGGVETDLPRLKAGLAEAIAAVLPTLRDPHATLRENGGFVSRIGTMPSVWWMGIDLRTDGLSAPDLAAAERAGRRAAWDVIAALRALHPDFAGISILTTGPQIGIRETRRPVAVAPVTAEDAATGRRLVDGVGRACWPVEIHDRPGQATFIDIGGDGFFDIPADALRLKGADNVWLAGRAMGSDRIAYGSIRVMGTAFASGHAAGIGAGLQAGGLAPAPEAMRRALAQQGAIL